MFAFSLSLSRQRNCRTQSWYLICVDSARSRRASPTAKHIAPPWWSSSIPSALWIANHSVDRAINKFLPNLCDQTTKRPINLAGGGEKHDLPRRTGRALPPPESAADDRICSARWWSWWRIFALGVCYKLCGICIGSSASNCSGKQVPIHQQYEYCHMWSQHFDDPVHDGGSQHQK